MKTRGYAADTTVPAFQSRSQIEQMLAKHGCSQYATAVDYEKALARVQFRSNNRIVRFEIELPGLNDKKREQRERQRWRQLWLVIKAKLESVNNNISTFEEEFLAHIVMPNDQTIGAVIVPLIESAYRSGIMPKGLLALPEKGGTS